MEYGEQKDGFYSHFGLNSMHMARINGKFENFTKKGG